MYDIKREWKVNTYKGKCREKPGITTICTSMSSDGVPMNTGFSEVEKINNNVRVIVEKVKDAFTPKIN